MAATTTHTTGNAGERTVAMFDLTTTEGFTAARADWKAAGCPANHPYMTAELPAAGPIEPLVGFITTEMVAAAEAMRPLMPERAVWA